ncbi:MAG TPA: NADH-quinone oxidoreductase subunit J [Pseudonocardiaceae bacterium]|jgi:NADH-quinone oxidoreductase subunit J|nr:NADH-quinone oxidoreductase subunit J [Pseudonocardiaceae bacterium]
MTTTGEAIVFWILGPVSLAGALGMLFSRSAVHSALWLVLTMLSLGVLYMMQQAPFLGFVQIIVYTGAIMMLFLFVLMMVGRDSSDSVVEVLRGQRLWAGVLGVGLAALIVGIVGRSLTSVTPVGVTTANSANGGNNVANIGRSLFTDFLFPFELTSALLITAAVGAMVLAFNGRKNPKRTQRELVDARFRGEYEHAAGRPGPGVFATANSVATPALLPDGSIAPDSLFEIINSANLDEFEADRTEVAGDETKPDAHALGGESHTEEDAHR